MTEYITCFKEFPLEVKADCAIQLFLDAYLGQEYKCGVREAVIYVLAEFLR